MLPKSIVCVSFVMVLCVGIDNLPAQSGTESNPPQQPTAAPSIPQSVLQSHESQGQFDPTNATPDPPAERAIEFNDLRRSNTSQIPAASPAGGSPSIPDYAPSGVATRLSDKSLSPQQSVTTEPPIVRSIGPAQPLPAPNENSPSSPAVNFNAQDYVTQTAQDRLAPAGYNSSIDPPQTAANPAAGLLDDFAVPASAQNMPGQPMQLLDILANADLSKRRQIVRQYWDTYAAWAKFRCAQMELNWFKQLNEPTDEISRMTFRAAESAAQDHLDACQIQLTDHQNRLNGFLLGPPSELLPLPSDKPLVGNYRTHFDIYAARGPMPHYLRVTHQYLPQQKALIQNRAGTVRQCRQAVSRASQMYSQGMTRIGSVLTALDLARRNHETFVDAVTAYNQRVGEYALAVKPNQSAPDQIVAMLIPAQTTLPATNYSDLRQATLPESFRNNTPRAASVPPALRDSSSVLPPARSDTGNFAPSTQYPSSNSGGGNSWNNSLPPSNPGSQPASGNLRPTTLPQSGFNSGGFNPSSSFNPSANPQPPTSPGGSFER